MLNLTTLININIPIKRQLQKLIIILYYYIIKKGIVIFNISNKYFFL